MVWLKNKERSRYRNPARNSVPLGTNGLTLLKFGSNAVVVSGHIVERFRATVFP